MNEILDSLVAEPDMESVLCDYGHELMQIGIGNEGRITLDGNQCLECEYVYRVVIEDGVVVTKEISEKYEWYALEWGPWRLRSDLLVLEHIDNDYQVDLEECFSSSGVLDWIVQIANKDWGRTDVAGLVRALDDLFHIQANLCSFGRDLRITKDDIVRFVGRFEQQIAYHTALARPLSPLPSYSWRAIDFTETRRWASRSWYPLPA